MGSTLKKKGDKGVVTLEGELTLSNAEELKKTLIQALIDTEDVSIVIKDVQDVDLSCLQLLCSLHRSAVRLNKKVAFQSNRPEVFTQAVEAAGFGRASGCKLDTDKSCLWMCCGRAS